MESNFHIKSPLYIVTFILLILLTSGCIPSPEPIAQTQDIATTSEIEIVEISEGRSVPFNVSQEKIFDQCASASPLKAEIQFTRSTGQESQQELILTASVGGEVTVSPIAKLNIGAAVEGRFSNTQSELQGHAEKIGIEVPPYVRQKYIIVWQENRQEGTVEYIENGEHKMVSYSYKLGVELLSSTVMNLECPDAIITSAPPSEPTNTPLSTNTPQPTNTSFPTNTPLPSNTPLPANTSAGSTLAVREVWRSDGRELTLTNYTFQPTRIRFDIIFTNKTGGPITFDIALESFSITDNLGRYYTAEYPLGCGTGGAFALNLSLDSGESEDCEVYFGDVDYGNLQVTELVFSVTASVFQNASWQIPIQH